MKDLYNLFPKDLYHSYIVEGDPETTSQDILELLINRKEVKVDSPDIYVEQYDSFTIEDSRKIKKWHNEMKVTGGKRVCIIGTNFINHDAEQALLKIIEEPAEDTHIFIVVPNSLLLLDTILSRAHTVSTISSKDKKVLDLAQKFISFSKKERIDFIASQIKKDKNKITNSQQRMNAILLINELENIIFQQFKKDLKNKELQFIFKRITRKEELLKYTWFFY